MQTKPRHTLIADDPTPSPPAAPPQSTFAIAVDRVIGRYTPADWMQLKPAERTAAIYDELRRLDHEIARKGKRAGAA